MKIAIHERKGSFSDRWIEYCQINEISYIIVNCYDSDIIKQLSDFDGLMWHWDLTDYKAALFAKQLTFSLEKNGLKVFPNSSSSWHYDDKVGQKYLLDAIDVPLVPSYVFYSKEEAIKWIKSTQFPLVFKLRGGAGAINVKLVKNLAQTKRLIKIAFGRGFAPINRFGKIKSRIINLKNSVTSENFSALVKSIARIFIPTEVEKFSPREKGYLYFQEFIPQNNFDERITVIGNRCVFVRRYNRENDFRASGSNNFSFDQSLANLNSIKLAFAIAKKLGSQSVGFDFIYVNGIPKIVEMSYAFPMGKVGNYPGYWDQDLVWYEEKVNLQYYIVEDFVNELEMMKNN